MSTCSLGGRDDEEDEMNCVRLPRTVCGQPLDRQCPVMEP